MRKILFCCCCKGGRKIWERGREREREIGWGGSLGARAFLMDDWKRSREGRRSSSSERAWSLSRYTSDTGLTTLKNGGGRLEGLVGSSMPRSSSTARKRSEQWMWSCCCLLGGFLMLLLLFTCIGVVLWLVFRPHSPEFSLQALNITSLTVCCCFNLFCFPPSLPLSLP